MKVLVTGCYGFIPSYLIKELLDAEYQVVGFGRCTDQRNLARLHSVKNHPNLRIVHGDLNGDISGLLEGCDVVVHAAAKTFVDHSILDPEPFIQSNIIGTYRMLEQARMYQPRLYIQVSTDEVYGQILTGSYKEDAPLNPRNPYASAKAASDLLALSYFTTYKLPVIVTRTENNCGPYQHPQKAFPVFVKKALAGESIPVYGDGGHSRMWLYVADHCGAIMNLITDGIPGNIYHVAGEQELTNLQLARWVLKLCGKADTQITFIPDEKIRPGHDRRYSLSSEKIRSAPVNWKPQYDLEKTITETVNWYKDNPWWLV